jgi:hypothetical protein
LLKGGKSVVPSTTSFRLVQIFSYVSAALQIQVVVTFPCQRDKRSWSIFVDVDLVGCHSEPLNDRDSVKCPLGRATGKLQSFLAVSWTFCFDRTFLLKESGM